MTNTDSFIEEVSEEVRRDRLFKLFRRWGWVAVLVVVGIVGGAAHFEWQAAQDRAQAEAFGDAVLGALDGEDPEARIAALQAVDTPTPEAQIILALLAAAEAANGDDPSEAATRLREAAAAPGLPRRFADLALLKAEMLDPAPEDEARLILETLAAPGAPYSALAEEQLALLDVRSGDVEAGLDRLRSIERSAAATAGLQQRAAQLIVALESGAVLVDEAPDAVAPEPVDEDAPAEEDATVEEDAAPLNDTAPAEEGTPAEDAGVTEADTTDGDADAATADEEAAPAEDAEATDE
ncbi:hypothetical protein [Hasllibacter sp. MH4015]|uniref:hypothetical protein n=1 Tax=Hasllibacter sp. MH4015 TaxID=2854029 RepID=UPI001CD73D38|nr:hypothetical protein [Hasllibacter sp. MH4015]